MAAPIRHQVGAPASQGGRFKEAPHAEAAGSLIDEGQSDNLDDGYSWTRTYSVPERQLEAARRLLVNANRKLERNGITDEKFEMVKLTEDVRKDEKGNATLYWSFELNRPRIAHEGWTFNGAHEFTDDGQVISHFAGDAPEVTDSHCDHCGVNRKRGRVYTVHSEKDGDLQIGKSCLKYFMGASPEGLWALTYEPDFESEEIYDDEGLRSMNLQNPVYDVNTMMLAALQVSNGGEDFVSNSHASWTNPSTSEETQKLIDGHNEIDQSPERQQIATDILQWVDDQPKGDSDYTDNLKAALISLDGGEKWVRRKHLGIAVSAISGYRRSKQKALEAKIVKEQKAENKREFFAAPKEKIEKVPGRILRRSGYEGDYGWISIITMRSDSGHLLVWKTASDTSHLQQGAKVTLDKATVKENDVYRDDHQTTILRPKFTVEDTPEAPGA